MLPRLALVGGLQLLFAFFAITSIHAKQEWSVFYDSEKGADHLSVSREPQPLDFYTNAIPSWNSDLRLASAKIISANVKEEGIIAGLRVVEIRLSLRDMYYSDALMILEEMKSGHFLPVYIQDYDKKTRWPTETRAVMRGKKLVIVTGMDYAGTGHYRKRYKLVFSPSQVPELTASSEKW